MLQYTVHPESINLIHVYAESSYTVRTDVGKIGIEINIIYHNDRTSEKILAKILLHRLKDVNMDKTYEYFSMHHSLMLQERNRDREFS